MELREIEVKIKTLKATIQEKTIESARQDEQKKMLERERAELLQQVYVLIPDFDESNLDLEISRFEKELSDEFVRIENELEGLGKEAQGSK